MILAPNSRLLLLDSLKPPPGFHVDAAIGTTYTLSLDALLIPPAAWASHAVDQRVDAVDPILLANTLRQFAERTVVFHQAGFAAPFAVGFEALAPFLDEMIYPVVVPHGSTFHPKVWILRFRSESGEQGLRLLIGSRNLSLVTTWDAVVRLDSTSSKDGEIDGAPLAAWLRSVPDRLTVSLSPERRAIVDELVADLETTQFRLPAGVESVDILAWSGSSPIADQFPASCENRLIISPFLGGDLLSRLPRPARTGRSVLVARPASLAAIAKEGAVAGFDPFTLRTDVAGIDEEPSDAGGEGTSTEPPTVGQEARLGSDLHAKVFAFDDGERATVILGSANATSAAFAKNDEVVVRLAGPVETLGVLEILGESDAAIEQDDRDLDLGMLLEPWVPTDGDDPEPDGRFFEAAIAQLAAVGINGSCSEVDDGLFDLTLSLREAPTVPDGIAVEFSLLGQSDALPVEFLAGTPVTLRLPLEGVTRLVLARLSDLSGEQESVTSVLVADFDPPARRHVRALRGLLTDKARFLRFLRFLLESSHDVDVGGSGGDGTPGSRWRPRTSRRVLNEEGPILEQLLRLLAQDPAELRHLRAVISEFADDDTILPQDFKQLWSAIEPLIPTDHQEVTA